MTIRSLQVAVQFASFAAGWEVLNGESRFYWPAVVRNFVYLLKERV